MKLILHIGMGKTGSSAIQKALAENTQRLTDGNAHYLGMWLTPYEGPGRRPGHKEFFDQPKSIWRDRALDLSKLANQIVGNGGPNTFISSNESFFHYGHKFESFVDTARDHFDVKILAYVRRPMEWLPSAYAQWGIRHKTVQGPIPSYGALARSLVHQYEDVMFWQKQMGDMLTIRSYDLANDIVRDFFSFVGVPFGEYGAKFYKRVEDAESILRLVFNNRYDEQVEPDRFNGTFGRAFRRGVANLDELVDRHMDYDETRRIINENIQIFECLEEKTGIDLLESKNELPKKPTAEDLRARLLEYLIESCIDQSLRIRALEKKLDELDLGGF